MRLARMAAGALVGVAVLAGCTSERPANETLPSAAPTSTEASATLPPLGPPDFPMPPEARKQTPEGVQAFATYYIGLINRLQQDLDSTYLRNLSHNCGTCDRIAGDAEGDEASGLSYRGGTLTIESMGSAIMTDSGGELAFTVNQDALEVIAPDGRPVEQLSSPPISQLPGGLSTIWASDHWLVSSLSFG